jgi:hypothetical protein
VSATTAGEWLAAELVTPFGRQTLLDPRADQVAVGAARTEGSTRLASVVSGYSFFHGTMHADVAKALVARVDVERDAHGRHAAKAVALAALDDAARSVTASSAAPDVALRTALQAMVDETGKSCRGIAVPTIDPSQTPLPPAMLRDADFTYAVSVAHERRKGAAWGDYVVLWLWTVD